MAEVEEKEAETVPPENSDSNVDGVKTTPLFRAGDCVCTAYGAGVIVQKEQQQQQEGEDNDDDDDNVDYFLYAVRLWRIPGKSMGSSALAFLQPSMV